MVRGTAVFIALCVIVLLHSVACFAGTIEMRVSQRIIQLYVEHLFPVEVEGAVSTGGQEKIPTLTRLTNPRVIRIWNENSKGKPVLLVNMDYEIVEVVGKQCIEKGHVLEKMSITVSDNLAYLTLSPSETGFFLPTVSLHVILPRNSVKIPLLKDSVLPQQGESRKVFFKDIRCAGEDGMLVIKSTVHFTGGP